MSKRPAFKPDEIGAWSEIKLDIVRDYASAYSKILAAQKGLRHLYIDAFAGAGAHISRTTGKLIPGSPANALSVEPPFCEYHLIDIKAAKVAELKTLKGDRDDVLLYEGDCNSILLNSIFPKARYEDYRRALCLLDPYGLHLNWEVIKTAGQMKSVDMFLNFPIHDMNRNVLLRDPNEADPKQIERMNAYWGDESWREAAYKSDRDLFDDFVVKQRNEAIAGAFRERLRSVAAFDRVLPPLPMKNSIGATVYYLFFASQKPVAEWIVKDIFRKHRGREAH